MTAAEKILSGVAILFILFALIYGGYFLVKSIGALEQQDLYYKSLCAPDYLVRVQNASEDGELLRITCVNSTGQERIIYKKK